MMEEGAKGGAQLRDVMTCGFIVDAIGDGDEGVRLSQASRC